MNFFSFLPPFFILYIDPICQTARQPPQCSADALSNHKARASQRATRPPSLAPPSANPAAFRNTATSPVTPGGQQPRLHRALRPMIPRWASKSFHFPVAYSTSHFNLDKKAANMSRYVKQSYLCNRNPCRRQGTTPLCRPRRCPLCFDLLPACPAHQPDARRLIGCYKTHLPPG